MQQDKTRRSERGALMAILAGLACLLVYGGLEALLASRQSMMEGDLYRILFGLLDGEIAGTGLLDPMHYGASFSYGYLSFIYAFAGDSALHHPAELIGFINRFGYWSAVLALICMWLALEIAYGAVIATAALMIFGFSPLFITLGASGHPVLPALLLLMAGAAMIFAAQQGWKKPIGMVVGAALLVIGLTMRADIVFALPWIALTHPGTKSWKDYRGKVTVRVLLLAGVFTVFLLIRHFVLRGAQAEIAGQEHPQTLLDYMAEFFKLHNILAGGMSGLLGCGIATTLALVAVMVVAFRHKGEMRRSLFVLAGPVAIMIAALGFWLPIGINARHFIIFLFGASLFIPLALKVRLNLSGSRVLILAAAIAAGNQLLGEALRPVLLQAYHSAYLTIPDERRTFTMAPLGFTWDHVRALQRRHVVYDEWARGLNGICDAYVIVMVDFDDAEQAMSNLYGNGLAPKASLLKLQGFRRVVSIAKGAQTFVFVVKADIWPADPLVSLLSMPALEGYKILIDPYSISVYDHAKLPADRMVHTGCHP